MLKDIRVITLDLDDTLWDNRPTLAHAEDRLHQWLQEHMPLLAERHSVDSFKCYRKELSAAEPALAHDMTLLRFESMKRLAQPLGYTGQMVHDALQIFLHARNNVTLYDDVIPSLTRLKQDHSLVALSNGNADIGKIGIGSFFDMTLSPSDVGTAKPDPEMFYTVMERLDVDPGAILHVGDEPMTDILGAQRAGVRCIWINRQRQPWPGGIPAPTAQISSLMELTHCDTCQDQPHKPVA